jgi:hypothetical protein
MLYQRQYLIKYLDLYLLPKQVFCVCQVCCTRGSILFSIWAGTVPSFLAGILCLPGTLYMYQTRYPAMDLLSMLKSRIPFHLCMPWRGMHCTPYQSSDRMYLVMYSVPKLACSLAHLNPNPPPHPPPRVKGSSHGKGIFPQGRENSTRNMINVASAEIP